MQHSLRCPINKSLQMLNQKNVWRSLIQCSCKFSSRSDRTSRPKRGSLERKSHHRHKVHAWLVKWTCIACLGTLDQ
uniref:Uncharacterized protein n=1 Tax=Octopus bimaculoides TaxID=37653 RepID=A0A0L8FHH1_OCTBM